MENEFEKLIVMLDKNGISSEIITDSTSKNRVLRYPNVAKSKLSVAFSPMSYGYEQGLLETWSLRGDDDVVGFQTAQEVFDTIMEMEKARGKIRK